MKTNSKKQMTIGKAIKSRRQQLGWSSEMLAIRSGLSAASIYNIESGKTPRAKNMNAVEKALRDEETMRDDVVPKNWKPTSLNMSAFRELLLISPEDKIPDDALSLTILYTLYSSKQLQSLFIQEFRLFGLILIDTALAISGDRNNPLSVEILHKALDLSKSNHATTRPEDIPMGKKSLPFGGDSYPPPSASPVIGGGILSDAGGSAL